MITTTYVEYDEDENFIRAEFEFTAEEAKPEYTAEKGNGETWTKGSEDGMTFVFRCSIHDEDTFSKFRNITVDGTAVGETMYAKEAGSLVLTLKPEYLETLDAGEHTLEAEFEDGTGTAVFNIAEAAKEPEPEPSAEPEPTPKPEQSAPKTGDSSKRVLWASLLGGSLAVVLLALFLLKKNRKE